MEMLSGLGKSSSAETPEELARNDEIKRRLINELSVTVKELQKVHMDSEFEIDKNDEYASMLCTLLESALLHGYHERRIKMSNFYNILGRISSEFMPSCSFWSILTHVTHKDILYELENLSHITSSIGQCRAWVRLALNDCLMESYLNAMLGDSKKLDTYYKPNAFMRDGELPYIMISFLQGLTELRFNLNYNTPSLNSWTGDTLALAGVWQLAKLATPMASTRSSVAMPVIPSKQSAFRSVPTQSVHAIHSVPPVIKEPEGGAFAMNVEGTCSKRQQSDDQNDDSCTDDILPVQQNTDDSQAVMNVNQSLEGQQTLDSVDTNNKKLPSAVSPVPMMGSNKLGISTGWSSAFQMEHSGSTDNMAQKQKEIKEPEIPQEKSPGNDGEPTHPPSKVASYKTLLSDYTVQSPARFAASVYEEDGTKKNSREISIPRVMSAEEPPNMTGFEIVPHSSSVHSEHTDDRTQALMSVLTHITNEQGLDSQNYQCKGCGRNIGMIYGEAKVCKYDACYYCFECHVDDEHVIPARIIYNWDMRKHHVSRFTKLFLLQIEEEPLLNIDETNPSLYSVVNELQEIKVLRSQLQHLKGFLFTCKEPIAEDVRRRIWPREYLWDDIHQYSLLDLIQVQSGQLAHHLKKVISHCTKHVYKCKLCCQKGFICEVCNDPRIIYPFEVKSTSQCTKCKSVFHKLCIADKKCPKCVRRKKLNAAKVIDKTTLEFDSPW